MLFNLSKQQTVNLYNELKKVEEKSTCAAKKVGCIIMDFNPETSGFSIISSGYNKSCSSTQCNEIFKKEGDTWYYKEDKNDKEWLEDFTGLRHKKWSMIHEVHAEIDAITNYKYSWTHTMNLGCIVTYSPCLDCCKNLINLGVRDIFFEKKFDNIDDIIELTEETGVRLHEVNLVQVSNTDIQINNVVKML